MRHPSNAIGWLFLSIGLVAAIEPASIAYLTHPSLLPGRQWAAWTSQWVVVFGFGLVLFVLLLFPKGRLVSRRWRTAMWLSGLALFVLVFGLAFTPRQVHDDAPAPISSSTGHLSTGF
jgi:hypothetical protein